MKKITSLFALMCATTLLFAAEPKVVLDFTDAGWGFPDAYVTTEKTYTNGDYTISLGKSDNGHKYITSGENIVSLLFGKKDATLSLPAFNFKVGSLVIKGQSNASGKVTYNVYVGENAVANKDVTSSKEDHTFIIPSAYQVEGTVFTIKVTNDNNAQISSIEVYEVVAGTPEAPVFSLAEGIYTSNQQVTLSCPTEGAKIYYTTNGTTPTKESTEYTAAISLTAGTTTIKAIAIKNDLSSAVTEATYTIATIQGKGTKDAPFTVKDVQTLTASYADKCWVEGYILGVSGSSNSGAFAFANTIAVSNLVIADVANEEEPANAIPVELKNGSDARTQLNIKDNSANIGKKVKLYGTLESYFSTVGVKNIEEFELEGSGNPTGLDNVETLNINAPMYNLMGQQVTADYKGIVLQNGQKYLLQ